MDRIKNSICFDYSHKNQLSIESPSYSGFTQFLFGSSFQLGKIQAGFSSLEKTEKYSVVVIGGPRDSQFTEQEIAVLVQYVKEGGSLIIINDEGGDYGSNCNISDLTKYFGFVYESDILFDSVNFQSMENRVLITDFEPHPICEHLDAIVHASACSIQILKELDVEENINVFPLAKCSINCYRTEWNGKEWIEDLDSPRSTAAVGVNFYEGRVIGLSTVSLFSSLSSSYGYYARSNQDFVVNIFNWLLDTGVNGEEDKWLSIPVNMNLYLWMEELVQKKEFGNIEVIVNFALKYLKNNFQEILRKESQRIEELREKHYKSSLPQPSLNGEVTPISSDEANKVDFREIFDRSEETDDDLLDIMSSLKNITGGKVGADFDLDEFKKEIKNNSSLTPEEKESLKQEKIKASRSIDVSELNINDEDVLRNQLESKKIVTNLKEPELILEDGKDQVGENQEVKQSEGDSDKESGEDSQNEGIKARADAALEAAFESIDSFEEFQKKLEDLKKISDEEDPEE